MKGARAMEWAQAWGRGLLLALCCVLASGRVMAVNLADAPLFISSGVEPNIMFVLDDSGSMRWGFMPDSLINNAKASGVNCANHGWYAGRDLCFFYSNNGRRYLASSYLNQQYYDPEQSYTPPTKGDGSRFADASFTSAPLNGYDPDSLTINLSNNYRAIMDDYYYSSQGGFTISHNGNAEPAFYFNFLDAVSGCVANPYLDDCYSKVNVANQSEEQKQNFANWFSYYRTRDMASKAGIGNAFDAIKASVRVGYGRINKEGTIENGVRDFKDENNRKGFFSWLYGVDPSGGTPLRASLDDVGQYYSRTDDAGPYSSTPGESGGVNYECRSSYNVLMTDGYWNGESPEVGNQDGNNGSPIKAPNGNEYTYTARAPFSDEYSDTLADVAMKYWKNDLQPDLLNRVPTSNRNPAFWQHMVTYGVGLGVEGSVDPDLAFAAIDDPTIQIDWDDPSSSDAAKIDDLLHAAVNSRGGFFSAADPDTFARELTGVLNDIVDRGAASSASVVANSTRLDTDSLVYQARFNPEKWSGDLLAFALQANGDVKTDPKWSAADKLDAMALEDRQVLVGAEQGLEPLTAAHLDDDGDLAAWILGDREQERARGGALRDRDSRLGDIVNSNPAFSGRQGFGYQRLGDPDQGASYNAFRASQRERTQLVLVAANDGMVHGFNADTGEELFAYIPGFVLDKLPQLADPNYQHQYFLDGSIVVIDAWLDSADQVDNPGRGWRTLAVGTAGAAGRGLYVLDITEPENPELVWELETDASGYMGEGISEVAVFPSLIPQRGNNPDKIKWVVAMGNGYNSASGRARLLLFDLQDPDSVEHVGVGTWGSNGLSGITAINASGKGVTADTIYGGDLDGNLWKFNQDASDGAWKVAVRAQGQDRPLFQGSAMSPITARPDVARVALEEDADKVTMVFFGTGKYLETSDLTDTSPQSLYGIIDTGTRVMGSDLLEQSILFEDVVNFDGKATPVRLVSSNELDDHHRGWHLPLIYQGRLQGERSVVRPVLHSSSVMFTTMIPSDDPCAGGGSSWVMALDKATGGRIDEGVFDFNDDGVIDEDDFIRYLNDGLIAPSGLGSDSLLTRPNVLTGPGGVDVVHTSDSSGDVGRFNILGSGNLLGRHSWRQIR